MNCLIVEDEKIAAERLVRLVEQADPTIRILDVVQSVRNSIAWLQTNPPPDLAFVDIQLSDGLSFEIFEQIPTQFPLIFTTAFDEYAIRAFKLNSIDYLLKPIKPEELNSAIAKYRLQRKIPSYPQHLFDRMLKSFTQEYKSRFVIKVGEHLRVIPENAIQCFYSLEKAVFLQNREGRDYAVNYTLEQLEEIMDPARFFRINRKYIIALDAIRDIVSLSGSRLLIKLISNEDDELTVSRNRIQDFKSWLEK